MSVALAGWCAPSEAGDWTLSFRETSDGRLPATQAHNPQYGAINRGEGGVGSLGGSSQVSVILEWNAWHEEDTSLPDEEIRLLVSSRADAMSVYWNGQSDEPIGTVQAINLRAAPAVETYIGSILSNSRDLVVVPNPGRARRLEMPLGTIAATVTAPSNPPIEAHSTQTAGYSVSLVRDDRAVKLTRGVGSKERVVVEDGIYRTYGDTVYSYKEKTTTTETENGESVEKVTFTKAEVNHESSTFTVFLMLVELFTNSLCKLALAQLPGDKFVAPQFSSWGSAWSKLSPSQRRSLSWIPKARTAPWSVNDAPFLRAINEVVV